MGCSMGSLTGPEDGKEWRLRGSVETSARKRNVRTGRGLCPRSCVCLCVHTHRLSVPFYRQVSVCEGERERKVKLTMLFRFGVSSPQTPAGPIVDERCPSHYHS